MSNEKISDGARRRFQLSQSIMERSKEYKEEPIEEEPGMDNTILEEPVRDGANGDNGADGASMRVPRESLEAAIAVEGGASEAGDGQQHLEGEQLVEGPGDHHDRAREVETIP